MRRQCRADYFCRSWLCSSAYGRGFVSTPLICCCAGGRLPSLAGKAPSRGPQFQRHKMHAYYHYATVMRLSALQVVQTFNIKPFTHPAIWPEPAIPVSSSAMPSERKFSSTSLFLSSCDRFGKQSSRFLWAMDSRRFKMGAPAYLYGCPENIKQDKGVAPVTRAHRHRTM